MTGFSRRSLARYAVDQLLESRSPAQVAKRLSAALIASKKAAEASLLLDDIAWELETRGHLARAVVTSANSLPDKLKKQLIQTVKNTAKVDVVALSEQIDKSVLGGFRLETANHTWDKTVRRQIAEIKGGI